MSEDEFWRIIEAAKVDRERQGGDVDRLTAHLTERLRSLPVEEIVSFRCWFEYMLDRAMTGLVNAAYVLISDGLGSDDGELYFRTWLVGQGEILFESAVKSPDVLADRLYDGATPLEQAEAETLRYAPSYACAAKTGLSTRRTDGR